MYDLTKSLLLIPPRCRCHSYDYGDTGDKICRLSHHSSATLRPIKEPFLEIRGAATYEMGACYNVTVACRGASMVAQVGSLLLAAGRQAGGSTNFFPISR